MVRSIVILSLGIMAISCKPRHSRNAESETNMSLTNASLYDSQTGKCPTYVPKSGIQGDNESYECAEITGGGNGAYIGNLRGARFLGNLSMAFFMNADLKGADFSQLKEVSHVTLENVVIDAFTKLPKDANCEQVQGKIKECVIGNI